MTERKRVLCSLLLLALFAAQLVYVCSAFALDPSDKYNTSLSLEEETEEDFPDSTEEEDNESESDYFVTQSEIVVFVPFLFKDEIKKLVIDEVNKSLNAKLEQKISWECPISSQVLLPV